MSKKLLLASLISMLLAGCNDEGISNIEFPNSGGSGPDTGTGGGGSETIPPTDILPPVTYLGKLTVGGQVVKGEVNCDGQVLTEGVFDITQGQSFDCQLGAVHLGSFTAPFPEVSRVASPSDKVEKSFNLLEQYENDEHGKNATKVLQTINSCDEKNTICVTEFDSIDIEEIYLALDNSTAVNEFVELKNKQTESEVIE